MRSLFRHLFLPHQTNNHRAKLLHIDALSVYAILLLLFHVSVQSLHKRFPDVLGYATNIYIEDLLRYTNAKREDAGLSKVSFNESLSQAAAKKAQDMFSNNYWAHYSPSGRKPWDFITESGYSYLIAGENLAKNFSDSKQVVEAWMASSSHRDNILKSGYQDIGFAVVNGVLQGEETTLVVQMFGNSGNQFAKAPSEQKIAVNALPTPRANRVVEMGAAGAFSQISKNPLIDINRLTRDVTFVVIGILMGIIAMDAWLIARRRIVRVSGHSMAHVMFLGMMLLLVWTILPGSIL